MTWTLHGKTNVIAWLLTSGRLFSDVSGCARCDALCLDLGPSVSRSASRVGLVFDNCARPHVQGPNRDELLIFENETETMAVSLSVDLRNFCFSVLGFYSSLLTKFSFLLESFN